MAKLHISRSIEINKPVKDVFDIVNNLEEWGIWSPWLIMEPEAKSKVTENGKYHEWEGKRVGSGNMRITNSKENALVEYDLNFLKPWKSHADVSFILDDQGKNTKVTWTMKSKLPFFLFWMKKMMIALLNLDYDRGLSMLKEYAEKRKVSSSLDFEGKTNMEGFKYVAIKSKTTIEELGNDMKKDIDKIEKYFKDKEELKTGIFFSQYTKWNMVSRKVEYTTGLSVKDFPKDLPQGFHVGEMPGNKVFVIKHIGCYEYLSNAWSATMSVMRSKEVNAKKGYPPFEIYDNDPKDTPADKLITKVIIPLKK